MESVFELVALKSGVCSLRSSENGETFHPVVGPMEEARALHVVQQRLLERAAGSKERFVIWDVGLGAAANAVAVLEAFAKWEETRSGGAEIRVELHSFDRTTGPLEFALENAAALGYLLPHLQAARRLLSGSCQVGSVEWRLHLGDFAAGLGNPDWPIPHAILFDPYSVKANPEMWSLAQFSRIRAQLREPCLLTNYTRSTAVRVTLLLAGFYVGLGHGVGEKDQTTVASNSLELLEKPLPMQWLQRVRFSTRSAPLRGDGFSGPIQPEDWSALLEHPQFKGQVL